MLRIGKPKLDTMTRVRLGCCVVVLLAALVRGDEISLVRIGEAWRHHPGTNEPSAPVTAWRQLAFDDSSWSEGPSAFSTTAYSATAEATLWGQAAPSRSFYLRRKFTVADPATVKWLVLRLDYTHGFVAYLNGQEIARSGLTNNPVLREQYASYHFSAGAEEFDVSASSGLLNSGDNVLAIQVHTAATNPPGYDNSIRLVPELLANFQRGPFVANAGTNSIQVIWRTPVAADSAVDFGTNQALGSQVVDAALTTNHVLTLTGLLAGTEYFYRIRSGTGVVTAVSPLLSFRTFKPSGDFTFLVTADGGDGALAKYQVANLMAQTPADLAFHCGDIVYDYFDLGREDYRCLSAYGRQMRSVPFYFSMGNHDVDGPSFEQPCLQTFYLPTNPVTGTEHFYSFDHGDAHFTVLFAPSLKDVPEMAPYQLTNGSVQYCWLTNDLATTTKPWKFVIVHIGMAASGPHRDDDDNNNGILDRFELQEWLLPVLQRYGVQVVFHGDDHDYERSNPMRGVYEITTGGGGGRLPNYGFVSGRDPASSQFYLLSEFVRVTVQGDSLLLQAIGTNGAVFDYMTMQRSPPPPQLYSASWQTPLVESTPANDGRGNINGQTFDFTGTPIATLAGDFSNLGCVYVNNDATNLFIGLEQTMIYSNQNIFLFIESPRQAGVTNLAGLGDGLGGTGEGVDGLDFLQNLSFTNFAPSVACLLGDEYADGPDRHFVRAGLGLDLGQGVFRLDTNFAEVSTIRLQQFNRSPQILEPPNQLQYPERNANFIKVAIPFDQLGGLRPGDTIKVAAVVGNAGYDTNAQTRELDTSFLGSSMSGAGQSNVLLGAVSVRLAPTVLTVTAGNQTRAYGATNGPLTVSYSGFLTGDDAGVLSGSPMPSAEAETNSPAGMYAIHVSLGTLSNASYTFHFVDGTLTVTKALLTVKADDQTRLYGATNAPLTASYSGFVNGQDTNILSGAPQLTTSADTNSPPQSYPIQISQGTLSVADTNYSLAFVDGNLTVVMPATIMGSPVNQVVTNGDTVLFTVIAQGTEPLACQWYFNQTNNLPGATNTTLVLSNVSPGDAGTYSVAVSNPYGCASNAATLAVITLPTITCAANRTVELGTPWDFETPTATGSNVTVNILSTTTNQTCGDAFSATRTWQAVDGAGYQASCSQTVNVVDTAPPIVSCAPDREVPAGADWVFDAPRARDAGVVDTFVYDNSVNDLLYRFDPGLLEVGNEIILAGTARYASVFSFEFWGFSTAGYVFEGDVQARVRFYKNDGPLCQSGYASPGTVMFDSGNFPIPATPAGRATLIFDEFQMESAVALRVPLPNTFTWTVQFSGLTTNDSAGVDLYAPPVIGNTYNDYWEQETNRWALKTNTVPMAFASRLYTVSRGVDVTVQSTVTNAGPGNSFTATRTWQATDACSNTASCSQTITVAGALPCGNTNYILGIVPTTTNSFVIAFLGTTNAQYRVLQATNLTDPATNWAVVPDSMTTATNGIWYYTVTNVGVLDFGSADGLGRFFRAQAVNPCP
jgi:hypothetical protein